MCYVAMQNEIKVIEATHTWDLTILPLNKIAIGCKWAYRIKFKDDGIVEIYKT